MKAKCYSLLGGVGVAAFGLCLLGDAAEPLSFEAAEYNYQLDLQVLPKGETAQHYKAVTAGGRIKASFLASGASLDGGDAPTILRFEAELEPVETNKILLRNFTFGQQVPLVTAARTVGAAREVRGVDALAENEAPGAPGDRFRSQGRRRVNAPNQDADPQAPDGPPSPRIPSRGFGGPSGQIRSVMYQDIGAASSVVLTLGKPVLVIEDPTQRVSLTLRKLED